MTNHYKFWIAVSLIMVFAAGVVGGLLVDKYVIQKTPERKATRKNSVHFPSLETMAKVLNLSPEQQTRIKDIFGDNEERFKILRSQIHEQLTSIRSQLKTEIKGVLTEEQASDFEAMIERYLTQRKKQYEERKKNSEKIRKNRE